MEMNNMGNKSFNSFNNTIEFLDSVIKMENKENGLSLYAPT